MSTIDTSTWNPDPALNESIGDIPLNESASICQTWQAIQMLMAAGGLHGLQLVVFDGATASADGKQGLVPAPEAGDQDKVLKGDGTWGTVAAANHTHGSITNDGKLGTASRAVVTDGSKVIGVSSVTSTELGYLSGVTSNVQTHLTDLDNEFLLVKGTADNCYAATTAQQLLIESLQEAMDSMLKTKIYPVGSTFFSLTDSRNPSVILGFGTWTKIEGKFLLGASSSYTANSTGGEATHTLTASELPDPTTYLAVQYVWSGNEVASGDWRFVVGHYGTAQWSQIGKIKSTSTTIGQAHNNMPPYLAGHLWRRTA